MAARRVAAATIASAAGGYAHADLEPALQTASGGPIAIKHSAYNFLNGFGEEEYGYGLYTYVLIPHWSHKSAYFIEALVSATEHSRNLRIPPSNVNLMYLPSHDYSLEPLKHRTKISEYAYTIATEKYNYAMAQELLARICDSRHESIAEVCETDLSGGPYLFTYSQPATWLSKIPPPFLFLDLTRVHQRAYGEFIAAYKAQVKRSDYTDGERLDALRLLVLNITLHAADWIDPIKSAVSDILHSVREK